VVKRVDSLLGPVQTRRFEWGRGAAGRARRGMAHALRRLDSRRRALPDFLIVGAQKAGTTSLHSYLCEHATIEAPSTKEIHYFDRSYTRGLGWYRAHFGRRRQGLMTGEATPYYLFHPAVPHRVAKELPGCRLIVLLRNPIDRAFSQHHHESVLGFEELPFEVAIEREPMRLAGEQERLLGDPRYRSFSHQHHSYLARGRYAEQLERWFECVGRDRILIMAAEDLFDDPQGAVGRVQDFLGLPRYRPRDLSAKNARSYAPIPDSLRGRLRAEFAPHNERLYELVGRDFGWD
jgi:Sulfotransferase domain